MIWWPRLRSWRPRWVERSNGLSGAGASSSYQRRWTSQRARKQFEDRWLGPACRHDPLTRRGDFSRPQASPEAYERQCPLNDLERLRGCMAKRNYLVEG